MNRIIKQTFYAIMLMAFVSVSFPFEMNAQSEAEKIKITPGRLHLTKATRFVKSEVPFDRLQPVYDGIFGLPVFNYDTYTECWQFRSIDGQLIFGPQWEWYGNLKPRFNSGVAVVKNPKNQHPVILYSDGRVKELPQTYGVITEFMDGVAMVREASASQGVSLFYININGDKVYSHLTETNAHRLSRPEIRPIECGRRAYYSNKVKKWGFLDASGKIVMQPQFLDVRDFKNGYALVLIPTGEYEGKLAIIDVSGNIICDNIMEESVSSMKSTLHISNVSSNGIFTISDNRGYDTKYIRVSPYEELFTAYAGMNFEGDYAFLVPQDAEDEIPIVVDKDFFPVGKWDLPFTYHDFGYRKPTFSPIGVATLDNSAVIDNKGNVILATDYKIGDFSEDGYAPFEAVFIARDKDDAEIEMTGYCLPTGEIVFAYCSDPIIEDYFILPPIPGELPDLPGIDDPIPDPPYTPIIENRPPLGPIYIATKYDVKVVAYPQEAATVYGSGKYEFGDTVRVTGTPNEGWKLVDIKCNKRIGSKTDIFNKFVVNGSLEITCYFVKDDEPKAPPTMNYSGVLPLEQFDKSVVELPIWLELSADKNIDTPYGNVHGYLAIAHNPDKQLHFANSGGEDEIFVNMFMAPMLVRGLQTDEETGKNYLMLDGGEVAAGNMLYKSNHSSSDKANDFKTLLANLMLIFDNFKYIEITPARYRIEIIGNIGDESFTFGKLERLSAIHGWLPGGDERFAEHSQGLFVSVKKVGLDQDLMLNRKMVKSDDKPQIWWYPTAGFQGVVGDETSITKVVEKLGETYREFTTDIDQKKNFNFSDFTRDLEKNLLKPVKF